MNNEKLIYLVKKMIEGTDFNLKTPPYDKPMRLFYEGRNCSLEWVLKLLENEDLLEQTYKMNKMFDNQKSENF